MLAAWPDNPSEPRSLRGFLSSVGIKCPELKPDPRAFSSFWRDLPLQSPWLTEFSGYFCSLAFERQGRRCQQFALIGGVFAGTLLPLVSCFAGEFLGMCWMLWQGWWLMKQPREGAAPWADGNLGVAPAAKATLVGSRHG